MRESHDPTPINIVSDPVIINLRMRAGSIEESNVRRDTYMAKTTRMLVEYRKILAKQSKILKAHDQGIAFQDWILSNTKDILRGLNCIQRG